jgi:putative membrane protein
MQVDVIRDGHLKPTSLQEPAMKRNVLVISALAALLATPAMSQEERRIVPTIPESQIEAVALVSPFQFLSAATSANEFVIKAGAHAEAKAGSDTLKSLATEMAGLHAALMEGAIAAGKGASVEIARPSVDGEQQGLLGKLEALDGADFDRAYVEALVFGQQRAIAIYRGYADKPDALGQFAAQALPQVIAQYNSLVERAEAMDGDAAKPQVPAAGN